jgi:FKBP-type peptidyl-prolyl cis-trans isomerase FkpA
MKRTLAVVAVLASFLAFAAEPGTPGSQPAQPGNKPATPPGQSGAAKPGNPTPGGPGMTPPPAAGPLTGEDLNKALYALGLSLGKNVGEFSLTKAELDQVIKGLTDEVTNAPNKKVKFEDQMPNVQKLFQERRGLKSQAEIKKGEDYQAKAAKEPGAEKLPSGLVLKHLKPGTGASPAPTDTVSVHYKGTLIDGTEFDSSYKRNQPTEFPLNGVIPCWTEGVGKMKVGGKAKLVCPSKIAYGDGGRPPTIPGGATLVFEVELLSIKGK